MPSGCTGVRSWPRYSCHAQSAAPIALPASPAAGWIHSSSNGPSRSRRPLATQLSATPPARHSFFMPVSAATVRASFSTMSSVTSWIERATSMCRCVSSDSGPRGGPSNSASNLALVIVSPVAKSK